MDRKLLGRVYRRLVHKYLLNDLYLELRARAKKDTVDYIEANLKEAMLFEGRSALIQLCLSRAQDAGIDGMILEFGVAGGGSIRIIAKHAPSRAIHGFDSFEGLPTDWTGTHERKGRYSQHGRLPRVPSNVTLHKGWFDQTLPRFLAAASGPCSLINMDCDTYESTRYVLDQLADRIVPGTIILFDEYYNYPNWREHEYKAWQEFVAARKIAYRYIGFSTMRYHAAVQVTAKG